MPLIDFSPYQTPNFFHNNPHFSTIYNGRFLKTSPPIYQRTRIELTDGDFLDIDFNETDSKKAVILCHGLEGASDRTYNNTAAHDFLQNGYSVFAWNNRSCSGEMNRLLQLYHHASIEDLAVVVNFVQQKKYESIYLVGFSMGAAQVLNYFGRVKLPDTVKAAVAVSVPIELKDSAESLKRGFNRVYLKNFIRKISPKLAAKAQQFPEALNWNFLQHIQSFDEIDAHYTAPVHGFSSKADYYTQASPSYSLDGIERPVLIVNAWDDPFLGEHCFPKKIAQQSVNLFLEIPKSGGHCAFPMRNKQQSYAAQRAMDFFDTQGN